MKNQNQQCIHCATKCNRCPYLETLKAAIALNETMYRSKLKEEQQEAIGNLLPGQLN
jgi:hypothetical protein